MSFFEIPKLQDITQVGEFPNICTDRVRSDPDKNQSALKWIRRLERYYGRINTGIIVREYSFKSHIHIPSNDPRFSYDNNDIAYFRSYDAGSDKVVIVIPQRGGGYNFARLVASYLASNGFDTIEIVTPFHEKRLPEGVKSVVELPIDIETIKLTTKQAVEEILGLVSFVIEKKEKELGIAGISQGAGYATIVSGLDNRIRSSAYIHGFSGIADLLLYSNDRFAIHFREEEKKRGGIDEMLEMLLRKELHDIEPLTFARVNNRNSIVMVNARNDKSLPKENIDALWKVLGEPPIHQFGMPFVDGHFYTALRAKKILKIVLEHFQKTLT